MKAEAPTPEARPPKHSGIVVPHQATSSQRIVARLLYLFACGLAATLHFRWERDPRELRRTKRPYVFCTWHNRLSLALFMYRQLVQAMGSPFRLAAIVSASRDGAMMARVLELFGVQPVRGSSSRRGGQALLELSTWVERGYDVAFATDGPRGPKYELKPGVLTLAQATGRPLVPVSYRLSRKIILKSWDGFQIPIPFSTCVFDYGEPLSVPPEVTEAQREELRRELEKRLRAVTRD